MRILAPDYRLATAEIIYRLPDYPGILQSYVWQDFDIPPHYPMLKNFLDFWKKNLDGKLYKVRVASSGLLVAEIRHANLSERIH